MRTFILLQVVFISVLVSAGCCSATAALRLSLQETIAMAGKSAHSRATLKRLEVATAEQEQKEIFGTFYSPRVSVESYSGLVPGAEGELMATSDDDLGPFFKIDLKIIQPIYSFGKYASAKAAGESNLELKKARLREESNQLSLEVAKAYLGTVAGREGVTVGEELQESYRQLIDELEESVDRQDSDFDDSDLLEAKSLRYEIEKQRADLAADTEQAVIYLKGLLNLEQDAVLTVQAAAIPAYGEGRDLVPLLQQYFRKNSPLAKSLESGLHAIKEKAELERKRGYPDLFLALGAGYGTASNRDELDNAWVDDDYNYERVGGVVGLKWEFNYHVNSARIEKALIEYRQLVEKKELALLAADGLIERLCGEAARNEKLLTVANSSMKSARSWLQVENDNRELGIGDMKRMVRAYQSYFQLKGKVIAARHRYLVTLAELATAAGNMDLFVEWVENGNVQL